MIGIGESYMAREWSVGQGTDLADALAPFAERMTDLIKPVFYKLRHTVLPRGLNPANTKVGARRNIEAHYDLSNEMFATFLDPTLSYSSALFDSLVTPPTVAALEGAQLRKVDAILDTAGVRSGSRVLEVGTGWGTLAIRAAERGAHVTSVTLSTEQAALAQQRVDAAGVGDRVEIAVRDYRDQHGEFDAIVSVEMIEAVGEEFWPTYFCKIESLLAPGGRAAIQAILISHDRMVATRNTYTWIHKYIFPGGMLPSHDAIAQVLRRHTGMHVSNIRPMGRTTRTPCGCGASSSWTTGGRCSTSASTTGSAGCGSSTSPTARPGSAPATSTLPRSASSAESSRPPGALASAR